MIEMPTGWLSPSGDLWKCGYYEHDATAEEICEKLNIPHNTGWRDCDKTLYSLRWCKLAISTIGNRQYWVHWERPLTDYQRYFLKDFFENEKELKFPMDCTSLCKYFHEDCFFNAKMDGKGGDNAAG